MAKTATDLKKQPSENRVPWVEMRSTPDGWNWLLWSSNGRPLAMSPRAYKRRSDAEDAMKIAGDIINTQEIDLFVEKKPASAPTRKRTQPDEIGAEAFEELIEDADE